jgi:hypothetical protein
MMRVDSSASPVRSNATRAGAAFLALHIATWLAAAVQGFIDPRIDNLLAVAFVVVSSSLTFLYVRVTRAMREVPLSTLAVLGLCMTTQWGALVGQAALADSLTSHLRVPLQTFGYLAGFQVVAISAHWMSRQFTLFMSARRIGSGVLARLGIFRTPAVGPLWVFGCVGLVSVMAGHVLGGNLFDKIADGFAFLAWAPFAIPLLYLRHGSAYCTLRRHVPWLVVFAALAVLLGLALNFRKVMLSGAMVGGLLYLTVLLDDERPFAWRQVRHAALGLVLVALLYQPVTYFMTAVQVARVERDKLSRVEMIGHTLRVLQDPAAVQRERDKLQTAGEIEAYDEYYFRSSILGRLVEIKYHDNGFYMVQGVSPTESRLIAEDAVDRVVSILPYPALKWLGLERSKFVSLYSVGDLLASFRLGVELGAYRTGSMFAQGIAIFGVWTPFLYFLLCIPVFIVWDVMSRPGSAMRPAMVTVFGMLLVDRLFAYGIVAESVGNIIGLLLRFQIQAILLYALVFAMTRVVWKPFDPSAPQRGGSGSRLGATPGVTRGGEAMA